MSKTNEEIRNVVREYGISNLASAFYEMFDEAVKELSDYDPDTYGYDCKDSELIWGEPNWDDIAIMAVAKTKWNDPYDKKYQLTYEQIKNIAILSSRIKELAVGRKSCDS